MFTNINEFLNGESLEVSIEGAPTERDLHVSVLALLSYMAHSDSQLEPEEISSITGTMYREFGLAEHEVGELFEIANFLVKDKSKIEKFIEKINSSFSSNQKQLILCTLLKVMLADGVAEKFETVLFAQIRTSLGLTMEQAVRARKLAELDKIQSLVTSFTSQES